MSIAEGELKCILADGRNADRATNLRIRVFRNQFGEYGTAAHIHVGAPGQSSPPIITLVKGADGTWSVPPDSKLTDEQYASCKSGNLYVNVRSAEHKPDEIRAQLEP